MELDELKQTWNITPTENKLNTDIMELIQHKSYGPLAALKDAFKKQIIFMAIIPVVLILTNSGNIENVLRSIIFWSYVAFCIGIIVFSYYNYRLVEKMELMDTMVKTSLEQHIRLLENQMNRELIIMRCVLLFFIVLVEVVPYIQDMRILNAWHAVNPFIRFSAYACFLALQYFMNRRVKQRKVGRHIDYLKSLVKDMQ